LCAGYCGGKAFDSCFLVYFDVFTSVKVNTGMFLKSLFTWGTRGIFWDQ